MKAFHDRFVFLLVFFFFLFINHIEFYIISAKNSNLVFLNEVGLDPGIDHLTAMKLFDHVKKSGGSITSFISWCGGLPAPEASGNPLGYKFSWSPKGVLLAGLNSARFKKNGKVVNLNNIIAIAY